jgi:hypothetical protein
LDLLVVLVFFFVVFLGVFVVLARCAFSKSASALAEL